MNSIRHCLQVVVQWVEKRGLAVVLIGAFTVGIVSASISADDAAQEIQSTRQSLEKWIEIRRLISEEKKDLALSKEMLNERIQLVRKEIESLRERISNTEDNIAETDQKRAEMIQDNERLKQASRVLAEKLSGFEMRIHALLPKLPNPIRDRIQPLSQRLPKPTDWINDATEEAAGEVADSTSSQMDGGGDVSQLTLSERFQNVVGILNEIDKFNQNLVTASEVHEMPDRSSLEVTAFYVGIGQGYYINPQAAAAGVGTVSGGKWIWMPVPEAATKIEEAVAIFQNEKKASFVRLPVEIK